MRALAHDSYFRVVAGHIVVGAVLERFLKPREQFRSEPDIVREYDYLT